MRHSLKYLFWGLISNAASSAFYYSPREWMQSEFVKLHRYALKKAHSARKAGEAQAGNIQDACIHLNSYQWEECQWCEDCGSILPHVSTELPAGKWTAPRSHA